MADCKLVLATDWDPLRACQTENHDTWGTPLTLEDYYQREEESYRGSLCNFQRDYSKIKEGVWYWNLKRISDDEIVCACETLISKSLNYNYETDKVVECYSAVVGSVYTFKNFRGNGYATHMMNSLNNKLSEILNGKFDFIFLYSEVGEYYSRFGYKSYHVPLIEIPFNKSKIELIDNASGYEMLTTNFEKQINVYDEQLEKLILSKGRAIKKSGGTEKPVISLKPTQAKIEWFYGRDVHTGVKLFNLKPEDLKFGISFKDPKDGFILWHLDFRAKLLMILNIHSSSLTNLKTLFNLMFKNLPDNLYEKIVIWEDEIVDYSNSGNTTEKEEILKYLVNQFDAKTGIENDSLSALRLVNPKLNDDNVNEVEWIGNGKWCWY